MIDQRPDLIKYNKSYNKKITEIVDAYISFLIQNKYEDRLESDIKSLKVQKSAIKRYPIIKHLITLNMDKAKLVYKDWQTKYVLKQEIKGKKKFLKTVLKMKSEILKIPKIYYPDDLDNNEYLSSCNKVSKKFFKIFN